jgi:hypothetical protein
MDDLDGYLFNPIASLGISEPFVFILDALDEWGKDHYEAFLKALAKSEKSRKCARFIFTSRNNQEIEYSLSSLQHEYLKKFRNHEVKTASDDVMKSYFQRELSRIPSVEGDDKVIDSLVKNRLEVYLFGRLQRVE